MNDKILQKTKKIAADCGYDDVQYLGKWKQYEIIEPIFNDDIVRYSGYPQFLMVSQNEIRWTKDYSESLAIMRKFNH